LESHPELRGCAVHCVECEIRFLTHPRNAGRINLRCPFGCRQHHRRQHSKQRSAEHYATPHGRRKKKRLNARRSQGGLTSTPTQVEPPSPASAESHEKSEDRPPEPSPLVSVLTLDGVVLDEATVSSSPTLPHLRLIVELIEGVRLDHQQLVAWLTRALRQHSIARRRRSDYVLAFLNQHPP
jgi:hypothetical protein